MDFDDTQLSESAKNAQTVSIKIGDVCADYINANKDRDPALVFGETIAGLMAAAATIQAITKRDPQIIAAEFELGVRVAGIGHPTDCLGEKLKDAVLGICDAQLKAKPNAPATPGVN